jgi:hypothetical protein
LLFTASDLKLRRAAIANLPLGARRKLLPMIQAPRQTYQCPKPPKPSWCPRKRPKQSSFS